MLRALLFLALIGAGTLLTGCQTSTHEEASQPSPVLPSATQEKAPEEPAEGAPLPDRQEGPGSADAPEGMVFVPGGTTRIGISEATWQRVQRLHQEQMQAHHQGPAPGMRPPWGQAARPAFDAEVAPFFLEAHPVTVAQFRRFTEATGYATEAEGFGDAGVMQGGRWRLVQGATWERPLGPTGEAAPPDHPVTQVSYNDAARYCAWQGRRLPTEVEWEHAARGAENSRALCPDGRCPLPTAESTGAEDAGAEQAWQANVWQGRFPAENTAADGYRYTAPVGAFGKTRLGLSDMSGNVWEWTSSWYRSYAERNLPFQPTRQSEKVQRGGSFQCSECGGYRVFTRSHSTPETALFHIGFRCAEDSG